MQNTYRAFKSRMSMKQGLRLALVPTMALAVTALASISHAQVTQITRAQLGAGDTTITFPGPEATTGLPNPFVLTPGGSAPVITFSNNATAANGNTFQRQNNRGPGGGSFGGDFATNTALLISSGNDALSALTLTFSSPVSEIGFDFEPTQSFAPENFTFRVTQTTGFNNTPIAFSQVINFNTPGTISTSGNGGGFFGIRATGANITSIVVSATATPGGGATNPNSIAIGPLRVAAVPEPGALALLAGAMLPMGLLAARRRRR